MGKYGIHWHQKGTHEKHLSVLEFEKQERAKEVQELEQQILISVEQLNDVVDYKQEQQRMVGQLENDKVRQWKKLKLPSNFVIDS